MSTRPHRRKRRLRATTHDVKRLLAAGLAASIRDATENLRPQACMPANASYVDRLLCDTSVRAVAVLGFRPTAADIQHVSVAALRALVRDIERLAAQPKHRRKSRGSVRRDTPTAHQLTLFTEQSHTSRA